MRGSDYHEAYHLLHHVDGTKPPPEEDDAEFAAWKELDALILQWIFATISDDILTRVLDTVTTARSAWVAIQNMFINNKNARAATLEQKFTNTTLAGSASFDEYCQTLKDIATQLADLGEPVSENRLVIQMVRGLPIEYDTIGALINQQCPKWDEARSMIESEQQRQRARPGASRETVMVHSSTPQTDPNRLPRSPYPNGYRGNNYDPVKAARGRGYNSATRGRGGRTQVSRNPPSWNPSTSHVPNSNYNSHQPTTFANHQSAQTQPHITQAQYPFNQAQSYRPWTPPPTPYPSLPAHYAPHQAHVAAPGPSASDYGSVQYSALSPTDIGMAMTNVNATYPDQQWHMDSGASSHITPDPGPQGWKPPFPTQ